MNTLAQLYAQHEGKVSDRWTLYLHTYDRVLSAWRDREVRMLEIGVQNGGSLEIWAKFFARAKKLVGCDINPLCGLLTYGDTRTEVIVGDANADDTGERIRAACPEFDLVVDDGSHQSSDVVRSFGRYFPMLCADGIFIAEDLHCSYWADFGGGLFDQTSSMSFFKALADVINHEHWGRPLLRADVLSAFRDRWGVQIDDDQLAWVHSVEFVNSVCIVRKAEPSRNVIGPRVVTRGAEAVASGHHVVAGAAIERRDQAHNPAASLEAAPLAVITRRAIEVATLTRQLTELQGQVDGLQGRLHSLIEKKGAA